MNTLLQNFGTQIQHSQKLHVRQVFEAFEVVLNWETRNKYRILDEHERPVAFAAEQSDGFLGSLLRGILGHWRPFKIFLFNQERQKILELNFPFRWFFKTLFIADADGTPLGHLQQRWALFRKKFDVFDHTGKLVATINSPFFKFWTFEFEFRGRKLGTVQKKWSGALSEMFTDKDNFVVSFADPDLSTETRCLMVATCLMIDIIYFETKKSSRLLNFGD